MTFFAIAGIVCTIVAIIFLGIYVISHKVGDDSVAGKIVCWVGMMFGIAAPALMTIEYAFPEISHPEPPYVPTVYDHFVEFYGDKYYTFIKETTSHTVVDEFLSVKHNQLNTGDENEYKFTNFNTVVIYTVDDDVYETQILNRYTYNSDYTYENVVSKGVK